MKAKERIQSNLIKKRQHDDDLNHETSKMTTAATAKTAQPLLKKQHTNSTQNHHHEIPTLGNILSPNHFQSLSSNQNNKKSTTATSTSKTSTISKNNNHIDDDGRSIAIIVPYRDIHSKQKRSKHLEQFVPYMITFLSKQLLKGNIVDYHIYIIEQSNDGRKFNRGKLLNIGFDIARKNRCRRSSGTSGNNDNGGGDGQDVTMVDHDVFIFHDVDLLPTNEEILSPYYTQFPTVPIHIARVWDRYSNNTKYFGGIVSFSSSDMKRTNGYPNTFWGWGGEDDEMQKRCERLNIKWEYPILSPKDEISIKKSGKPIITDLEEMNIQEKLDFLRSNREWKCNVKWEALDEHETTWKRNGLADLDYEILSMTNLDTRVKNESGVRSRATKVTVDVKLNGRHWTNDKCNINEV